MEKKKKKIILYSIAVLLALCFIWGQSCAGAEASTGESRFVTDRIVKPVVRAVAGENAAEKITEPVIRKAAHVAEYTVLGAVLGAILRNRRPRFWLGLLLGLAAAFLDETVQLFTGRGAMITDIWIDLIGVTLGGLVALLVTKKKKE